MYNDYHYRGYEPLAINLWEDMSIIKTYARQYEFMFLRDPGTVWNLYKINGYTPLNYVLDTTQLVVGRMEGFNEDTIRAWIEASLPPQPGISEDKNGLTLQITSISPNPASQSVTIRFAQFRSTKVTAQIYSSSGQLVRLIKSNISSNAIYWDLKDATGKNVADGLYICRLTNGLTATSAKFILLR